MQYGINCNYAYVFHMHGQRLTYESLDEFKGKSTETPGFDYQT